MATNETREHEVRERNASACPVVHAIDQVGTPWRLNVLHALHEETRGASGEPEPDGQPTDEAGDDGRRFNELKRATGARSKTLSDALDALEEHGLVDRRMEEASPVAVYYSLTEKGASLVPVLDELGDWADDWVTLPDDAPAEEPVSRPET